MIEAVTTSPLFGIVLCIGTFQIGRWVQKKTGLTLANPLVIAILLCIGVLLIFDIPYEDFAIGGDIVNMMLGPATAVLALNIYNQYAVLKRHFVPVLVGCTAGSLFSLASVLLLCRLFRLDEAVTAALLPKSCTTPIAVGIAESHGGIAAITMVAVLVTGFIGAVCAPLFAKLMHVTEPVAEGLAIGACSHALGTTAAAYSYKTCPANTQTTRFRSGCSAINWCAAVSTAPALGEAGMASVSSTSRAVTLAVWLGTAITASTIYGL